MGKLKTEKQNLGGAVFFHAYTNDGKVDSETVLKWGKEKSCYANAISTKDTISIGEEYTAKIFLQNAKEVCHNPNLIPTVKFINKESSPADLMKNGELCKMKNDTGDVRFIANNHTTLQKGFNRKIWSGIVTIHLPYKDTSFTIDKEYIIKK